MNRYELNERLKRVDRDAIIELLSRHPEKDQKIGCGVRRIEIRKTEYGSRGFQIIRLDGTETDFSYLRCITGKAPSVQQEVCRAFREAIKDDIIDAKERFFLLKSKNGSAPCAVSGKFILFDEGHVDHKPPMTFEVIVDTFLAGRKISYSDVPITTGADNQVCPKLTDLKLERRFRNYHKRVARLSFIHKSINLSQSAAYRLKPGNIEFKLDN